MKGFSIVGAGIPRGKPKIGIAENPNTNDRTEAGPIRITKKGERGASAPWWHPVNENAKKRKESKVG
jgi:hypothetical protein